MSNLRDKIHRAYKPNAQAFDEVKFVTVPRYKTSGLSGDEWRISVNVQFWRNGKLMHEEWAGHDMEKAMAFASYRYASACDNGKGHFAGEGDFCDQEGCSKEATVTYKKLNDYCREGHKTAPHFEEVRRFCEEHKRRGDCGLDDADANYQLVENKTAN